jgi:iron complex transport system substrate-binding protein
VRSAILALVLAVALLGAAPCRDHPGVQRIVSLAPSLTEDAFALGAGSEVVGVSDYSDWPPPARALPRIGSFAAIDAERIVALHPTLVVGIASQAPLVAPLRRAGLRVVLYDDDRFEDIAIALRALGAQLGRSCATRTLLAQLDAEAAHARGGAPRTAPVRAFVVLGVGPIFTVGDRSYIATLIRMAGGTNVARLTSAYDRYSAEALLAAQPEILIADPASGLRAVLADEPWHSLTAVREGHVAFVPDPGVLLRPGPRYPEAIRWLSAQFRALAR